MKKSPICCKLLQRCKYPERNCNPEPLVSGSSAPYARSLGGVIAAPTPNQSSVKPRGWGLGNGNGSAPTVKQANLYIKSIN